MFSQNDLKSRKSRRAERTKQSNEASLDNLWHLDFHGVLVLDEVVEGKVQHGHAHGVEESFHDAFGGG